MNRARFVCRSDSILMTRHSAGPSRPDPAVQAGGLRQLRGYIGHLDGPAPHGFIRCWLNPPMWELSLIQPRGVWQFNDGGVVLVLIVTAPPPSPPTKFPVPWGAPWAQLHGFEGQGLNTLTAKHMSTFYVKYLYCSSTYSPPWDWASYRAWYGMNWLQGGSLLQRK